MFRGKGVQFFSVSPDSTTASTAIAGNAETVRGPGARRRFRLTSVAESLPHRLIACSGYWLSGITRRSKMAQSREDLMVGPGAWRGIRTATLEIAYEESGTAPDGHAGRPPARASLDPRAYDEVLSHRCRNRVRVMCGSARLWATKFSLPTRPPQASAGGAGKRIS